MANVLPLTTRPGSVLTFNQGNDFDPTDNQVTRTNWKVIDILLGARRTMQNLFIKKMLMLA
jgi:hypothetical protein